MKLLRRFNRLITDKYAQQSIQLRSSYVICGAVFNVIYYSMFDRVVTTDPELKGQFLYARLIVFFPLLLIACMLNIQRLRKFYQILLFFAGAITGLVILFLMHIGTPANLYHDIYLPELVLVVCIAPLVAELTPFLTCLQVFVLLLVYNLNVVPEMRTRNLNAVINGNLVLIICMFFVALLRTYLQKLTASHKKRKKTLEREKYRLEFKNMELLELDSFKSKVLSVLSHDVRSPLNNIQGLLNMKEFMHSPADIKQADNKIRECTELTLQLLNNILEWSTSQIRGINVTLSNIRLHGLVKDVFKLFQPAADAKGLILKNEIPGSLTLWSDHSILQLLLRNLVSNAVKFTAKGSVSIGCNVTNTGFEIYVSDTGVGLADDLFLLDKSRITSSTGTNNEKGSGFGLILCNDYLARINGKLSYTNKATGGTVFYVYIPAGIAV